MKEQEYFNEIEESIKSLEINKKIRSYKDNSETLLTYHTIGKLLIEAQGGEARAKYGNKLVKEWSKILVDRYGAGYNYTNLQRFKKFFLLFPIVATSWQQFTWSHVKLILPIKDENKRNYYINQVIEKNFSVKELILEIKSNSYERLLNKPKHIEIINNNKLTPMNKFKNPIIINFKKGEKINSEHELEIAILSELSYFLNQLGDDYLLKANQYKVIIDGKVRYIDILLFNIEMNCYIVIELKLNKITEKDVGQTLSYMDAIDKTLKKINQNNTLGIIISKENDKLVANFINNNNFNIVALEYEIREMINI